MFCPKCGTENPDNGKFCRSCGANLSNILAVVEGDLSLESSSSENYADLYSSGIRNIILGFGFSFAGVFLFMIPPREGSFWLVMMIPGFCLLASGISRVVKAEALKKESKPRISVIQQTSFPQTQANKELPPTQTEYISPKKSKYKTDDLTAQPPSVIEETTKHLRVDKENETMTLPKN